MNHGLNALKPTNTVIRPQKGKQELFLRSAADVCIYGGAAGGGKTFALLLECLRHIDNKDFEAVIFRRSRPQIMSAGGLFATSLEIYPHFGATSVLTPNVQWRFKSGAKITFAHMFYEKEKYDWQGSQIPLLMFDELTHFTESQFFYMFSRNRSTCGVKPYVRATCNPDVDSWVAKFIEWWINPNTGYAIPERSGVVRVFYRTEDGKITWGNSRDEVCREVNKTSDEEIFPQDCKTATFISASIYDNEVLLKINPQYLSSLKTLSVVEKERLLRGNWRIRPKAGLYFPREKIVVVKSIPHKIVSVCRAWDLAATAITPENKNPDRTAGVLCAQLKNGQYIFLDVKRRAYNAANVRQLVKSTAVLDNSLYGSVNIQIPQDGGQAGKEQAQSYIRDLAGFKIQCKPITGNKISRAEPLSAQWQAGNVILLEGEWNEEFLTELEGFPDTLHDDQVDAAADAFNAVAVFNDWSWV